MSHSPLFMSPLINELFRKYSLCVEHGLFNASRTFCLDILYHIKIYICRKFYDYMYLIHILYKTRLTLKFVYWKCLFYSNEYLFIIIKALRNGWRLWELWNFDIKTCCSETEIVLIKQFGRKYIIMCLLQQEVSQLHPFFICPTSPILTIEMSV